LIATVERSLSMTSPSQPKFDLSSLIEFSSKSTFEESQAIDEL